jgi:methyl-accepting chemotaxis protein
MNIRNKLTVAFAGLALIVLLVAGLSLLALSQANARQTALVGDVVARGEAAADLRRAADERAIAVRNLVLVSNPADLEVEKSAVVGAHARVGKSLDRLDRLSAQAVSISPKARELVVEMSRIEKAYSPVALAIVDLALAGKKEAAIAMMNEQCRPLLASLVRASNLNAEEVKAQLSQAVEEAESTYRAKRTLLGMCSFFAVAFAIGAGVLVTRSILRPIDQAIALTDSVAAGDLTSKLEVSGKDEISRLLQALGGMSQKLEFIVGRVRSSSDSIATGSAQIASGNQDLSQRTEEQASALEKTAASMEQLGSTVKQNADNARQANQLALTAATVARQGGEVVGDVVTTMKAINDSSKRIADIVGVIDGIAFQTNILALNAAVEAARAGEQGRGFAVVASEVRSLAQRSAGAAREIKSLIATSVERVDQGSVLVDRAGSTMTEVVGAIQRVTDIMGEISSASNEQSAGITQIGEAVTQMDQVTQQNAALVEQSAAAAESLKQQAEQMVEAVAVFKLSPAAA